MFDSELPGMPQEKTQPESVSQETVEYFTWLISQFRYSLNADMALIMAMKAYEIFTAPER